MNKQQIKERLEKVKELYFIRKLTLEDTAKILGVSWKTAYRYAKKIRVEMVNQVKEADMDEYITRRLIDYNKVIESWWRIYDSTKDEILKNKVLRNIHKAHCDFTDELHKFGIIKKVPEEVKVEFDIDYFINKLKAYDVREPSKLSKGDTRPKPSSKAD